MPEAIDYIIVGHGISGLLISYRLRKANFKIKVFDLGQNNATSVSAGNINPVTGRKYTKSWLIDDLLEESIKVYEDLGKEIGGTYIKPLPIVRPLRTIEDENQWLSREGDPQYERHIAHSDQLDELNGKLSPPLSYGVINKALKIDTISLIEDHRKYLKTIGHYVEEEFQYDLINIKENEVRYKNYKAKGIIFCEGQNLVSNPFFNYLPFQPTKGEILHIEIKDGFSLNVRDNTFITPNGDYYWVGSNYDRHYETEKPTQKMYDLIKSKLDKALQCDYKIKKHITGIRPCVPDRKPLLGVHPKFSNIFLFNGMGTKGLSMAPYLSQQFLQFIMNGDPILEEANITRYSDYFSSRLEK